MTDATSDDVRDDFILQERLSGKSARSISKQLRCTVGEVNDALDRVLPTLDQAARLRHIALDVNRLDALVEVFYKRAMEKGDTQAGLCVVKILERKAALLGLDAAQRIDLAVEPKQAESSFDKIYRAIMNVVEQAPAAQRAVIKKMEELGPEKVLELINAGNGAGNGNGSSGPSDQTH